MNRLRNGLLACIVLSLLMMLYLHTKHQQVNSIKFDFDTSIFALHKPVHGVQSSKYIRESQRKGANQSYTDAENSLEAGRETRDVGRKKIVNTTNKETRKNQLSKYHKVVKNGASGKLNVQYVAKDKVYTRMVASEKLLDKAKTTDANYTGTPGKVNTHLTDGKRTGFNNIYDNIGVKGKVTVNLKGNIYQHNGGKTRGMVETKQSNRGAVTRNFRNSEVDKRSKTNEKWKPRAKKIHGSLKADRVRWWKTNTNPERGGNNDVKNVYNRHDLKVRKKENELSNIYDRVTKTTNNTEYWRINKISGHVDRQHANKEEGVEYIKNNNIHVERNPGIRYPNVNKKKPGTRNSEARNGTARTTPVQKTVIRQQSMRFLPWMDHKGNYSYRHVNLRRESKGKQPRQPVILQDTEFFSSKNGNVRFVLLMTYMRSGSSIISELLRKGDDSFLFFEPFWGLYFESHRTDGHICYKHGYCREPDGYWESVEGSVRLLKNLFSCNLMESPVGALESLIRFSPTSNYSDLKECFYQKHTPFDSRKTVLKDYTGDFNISCVKEIEKVCMKTPLRVIKTIRMPVSFAESFLLNMPELKIVHSVRDPRGVLNSRQKMGLFKFVGLHVSMYSHHLCDQMEVDIHIFKRLMKLYPYRIIPLTYDCLSLYPEDIVHALYVSLGFNWTDKLKLWIQSMFLSKETKKFEFVKEGQSSKISISWRDRFPFHLVRKVERACKNVLSDLGLMTNIREGSLRNESIPAFVNSKGTCLHTWN